MRESFRRAFFTTSSSDETVERLFHKHIQDSPKRPSSRSSSYIYRHDAGHYDCLTSSTRTVEQVVREGPHAPSPRGFSSLVRSHTFGKDKSMSATRYIFEAPGVIRVRSEGKKDGEPIFGAALHCIPIGQGRSRLLFKASFLRNTKVQCDILLYCGKS